MLLATTAKRWRENLLVRLTARASVKRCYLAATQACFSPDSLPVKDGVFFRGGSSYANGPTTNANIFDG